MATVLWMAHMTLLSANELLVATVKLSGTLGEHSWWVCDASTYIVSMQTWNYVYFIEFLA